MRLPILRFGRVPCYATLYALGCGRSLHDLPGIAEPRDRLAVPERIQRAAGFHWIIRERLITWHPDLTVESDVETSGSCARDEGQTLCNPSAQTLSALPPIAHFLRHDKMPLSKQPHSTSCLRDRWDQRNWQAVQVQWVLVRLSVRCLLIQCRTVASMQKGTFSALAWR